ncbi:MAG TPA: NAD(P)/FAD-dependent oxidoreductase [Methanomicrobia archaeon]|nr:NAD(P)/FAD-dependent oxidoreductase [Methanomicrobia archaeon]
MRDDEDMTLTCDVLVVGAGPGGSSAAAAAAEAGAHTIMIERKSRVGVPVQCGEGIGAYLLPFLPFPIPPEQLIWTLNELTFWAEELSTARTGKLWTTHLLNRAAFDAWLARRAEEKGAEVLRETELIALTVKTGYTVTSATVKTPAGIREIAPRVVIAADGVDATVLKLLGFKPDKQTTCGKVLSYEMAHLQLRSPRSFQVFLGDFAPGVYAYILPKSRTTANVGVGTIVFDRKLRECYDAFMELPPVRAQVGTGTLVQDKSGWAPIRSFTEHWVYDNVLLVGDVANQNFKPFVEGIIPTIICGDRAGKTAADFIRGKGALDIYPDRVRATIGPLFAESDQLIPILYELSTSKDPRDHVLRLCLFASIISLKQFEHLRRADTDYRAIQGIVERWTRSPFRQPVADLIERLGFWYLLLKSR